MTTWSVDPKVWSSATQTFAYATIVPGPGTVMLTSDPTWRAQVTVIWVGPPIPPIAMIVPFPCGPGGPWGPGTPGGPCGPAFPGGPCGPWGPALPGGPCGPCGPAFPGGPCGPWAPVQSRTFTRESRFRSSVAGSAIPFPFRSQQFTPFEPAGPVPPSDPGIPGAPEGPGTAHPNPTAAMATTIAARLNPKLTFPERDEDPPARPPPSNPLMRGARGLSG